MSDDSQGLPHTAPFVKGALRRERSRLDAQARFLKRIALAVNDAHTLGEVLVAAINGICGYTGWPLGHAYIVAFDEGQNGERLVSSHVWYCSAPREFEAFRAATESVVFRMGDGLVGDVWQSRAATSTRDVHDDPRFMRSSDADDLRGCFAFPLISEDRVVAVLEFFSQDTIHVDSYFLDAIETAGTLLGHAIEREAAAARLRESEARFRAVTQSAGDAIISADARGNIITWNRASEQMFGYSENEILGQPLTTIMPPAFRAAHLAGLERFIRTGESRVLGQTLELEGCRKDHTHFPIELCLSASQVQGETLLTGIVRDISARKAMEQERDFLTTAIEHASDGVAIYRLVDDSEQPFRISYVNDAFVRQSGYSREETMGQPPSQMFGPDTNAELVRETTAKLAAGEPVRVELFKYRKDGTQFWTEVNVRPVADAHGTLQYIISIQRDITERKRSEQELSLLSEAMQNATDMVIITEAAWRGERPPAIRYVNEAWVRTTGYSREESIDNSVAMLFGPLSSPDVIAQLRQTTRRSVSFSGELRCYRKDGTPFWMEFSTKPILDNAGLTEHWVGTGRDVSLRAATQAKLELLSTAVDRANDIIVMFERGPQNEWHISYVNDMFTRVTGFSAAEAIGKTSALLEGPNTDIKMLTSLRDGLMNGRPCRAEVAYYRKDGSMFWVELNARPLAGPDGTIGNTIVLYRDITESRLRREVLSHEAAHDALTGLHNRRFLDRALESNLGELRDTSGITHALLFLDLDGFKAVNDQHGHEAGDKMLAELSQCLRARLREGDVLARVGGDEFAVLLQRCSAEHAQHVAQQLIDAVRAYRLNWNGKNVGVGVSIGIAPLDASIKSAKAALRLADEACYAAKKGGRDRIVSAQIEISL